jgi:hypothetical protein
MVELISIRLSPLGLGPMEEEGCSKIIGRNATDRARKNSSSFIVMVY